MNDDEDTKRYEVRWQAFGSVIVDAYSVEDAEQRVYEELMLPDNDGIDMWTDAIDD